MGSSVGASSFGWFLGGFGWFLYWLRVISDGFSWFAVLIVTPISQHAEKLTLTVPMNARH